MYGFVQPPARHNHEDDPEASKLLSNGGTPSVAIGATNSAVAATEESAHSNKAHGHQGSILESMANSGLISCLLFKQPALIQHRDTLRAVVEFGLIMIWYFVADRTTVVPWGEKSYSRDVFIFLFVVLTSVALGTSIRAFKMPLLLNRPQTEEWKGWMQVLFLLYHYFEAKEVYNAIRIFIAAYVWMTGFGNFSYYYKTGDFCIGRFAQMLWRLNFLVFFACVVLRNSYMLYYICPMHTIFTVFVYLALAIAPQLNVNHGWLFVKILLCFAFIFVTWDLKFVFYAIWSPFKFILGYSDPRNPTEDVLHEWYFRSGLDRYIWVYGMLCALVHPQAAAVLKYIDELPVIRRYTARTIILSLCGVASYYYYITVYSKPKYEYNTVHPYTSWIPITLWIIIRNITPWLRVHSLRLYGWLGCITLETYISQFHIWMKTDVPDGQPKSLLVLIPDYPLLNFALVSGLYILVSHRLFDLTNTLKNAAVPHSNNALLLRNVILMAVTGMVLYTVVAFLYTTTTRVLA
ncbi:hypothetical protein VOLCADRAFT_106065 [Volvox carteri f. nagariensis]|uniref:Cas1p 10 TM acyl transferase domain-containing protein n=1 Tax=Volvox carteri f. nagariensis TaxID=3068 RepID=D8U4V1_VOLCA|nr:uncharacterized protein VOLCADRAFT_106065 [Volvox carteri f. nagariensis]EFJ45254.1 hypothetical protein VOLCADRAFT_106065 [Volvox carteri f. nagariensis]|eukprot:XP_002953630.1 hypothetical protein VOLCADRAFT_106065 [Volvox carteri f. nagariensis]